MKTTLIICDRSITLTNEHNNIAIMRKLEIHTHVSQEQTDMTDTDSTHCRNFATVTCLKTKNYIRDYQA